jgi:hypothetical protein
MIISEAEGAAWTTTPDQAGGACALENGAVVADGRRFRSADVGCILTDVKARAINRSTSRNPRRHNTLLHLTVRGAARR